MIPGGEGRALPRASRSSGAAGRHLRLRLAFADFLLPLEEGVVVETRDRLVPSVAFPVCALCVIAAEEWPVVQLDRELRATRGDDWRQAVFLPSGPRVVGLAVREAETLEAQAVTVLPFQPLGRPPSVAGWVFNAAWLSGALPVLRFDAGALARHLLTLVDRS